jgi:hypothetical protein
VHVVEVRGRADDVLARDDDVCGEGADGWVGPASEDAEPSSCVCAARFARAREVCLRGFGSERIVLPSASRNEEDALIQ